MKTMPNDPEMLDEYDFSNAVRGEYTNLNYILFAKPNRIPKTHKPITTI